MRKTNINKCPVCKRNIISEKHSIKINAVFRFINDFIEHSIKYSVCQNCGLVYMSEGPDDEFYKNFYNKVPTETITEKNTYNNKRYQELINKIQISSDNKILDIGCFTGGFLKSFKNNANCYGIEPSKNACEHIKKFDPDINIFNGEISEYINKLEKIEFDIVTMFHVFEHIRNVENFLNQIKKLKFENLIIEVPEIKYPLISRAYGHFYYYSENTLNSILSQNGFHKIDKFNNRKLVVSNIYKYSENKKSYKYNKKKEVESSNNKILEYNILHKNSEKVFKQKIDYIKKLLADNRKIILAGLGSDCCRILKQIEKYNENIIAITDKNTCLQNNLFMKKYKVISPEENEKNYTYEIIPTSRYS